MKPTKHVRPARPETKVAKPQGGWLAAEGEQVVWGTYWRRRVADGDAVVVETAKQREPGVFKDFRSNQPQAGPQKPKG